MANVAVKTNNKIVRKNGIKKHCTQIKFQNITCTKIRMMINHYTLDYHVTNLNTFLRWLWRKNQNPNTLL